MKKNILAEVTQKQNIVIPSSHSYVGRTDEPVGLWVLVWEKRSSHQSRKGLFVERGMKDAKGGGIAK